MLTELATVKARLALIDTTQDAFLNAAILAIGQRFERECNRMFARTVDDTYEFPALETEVLPPRYPIESVTAWHTKASEEGGWVARTAPLYVIRGRSVISLLESLPGTGGVSQGWPVLARITYTAGYVLPFGTLQPGQTALPEDIHSAATEQVAVWWQHREKLGLIRHWPSGGIYLGFQQTPLLPVVQETLRHHRRMIL